jgi:drug/metabolite transporter (DMT)-like permease
LELPGKYWAILGWLSFTSAFSFSIWYYLLQRPGVKVSELNLWKFIIPAVGAVLSWIFVPGEDPEWLTIAGILIITASLIGFFRSAGEKAKRNALTPEQKANSIALK